MGGSVLVPVAGVVVEGLSREVAEGRGVCEMERTREGEGGREGRIEGARGVEI